MANEVRLIDAEFLKKKFAHITYTRFTADMGQGGFEMFSEKEIEQIIDNAPEVEVYTYDQVKEGEWIPVSERLPEYSGLYLISVDDLVTVANFTGTYFMHSGGGRVEVYAWQQLPEPYKAGGKEE